MIDLTNKKWDFSKDEEYAVRWFEEHGFNGNLKKQFVSKTIFIVSRDGLTDEFGLPQSSKDFDVKQYMDSFERNWNIKIELEQLRREVRSAKTGND